MSRPSGIQPVEIDQENSIVRRGGGRQFVGEPGSAVQRQHCAFGVVTLRSQQVARCCQPLEVVVADDPAPLDLAQNGAAGNSPVPYGLRPWEF